MRKSTLISFVQVATAIVRVAGFSYAVLQLSSSSSYSPNSLILVIGYLPFVTCIDVLVQAYSRAAYIHERRVTIGRQTGRRTFALICVASISYVLYEVVHQNPHLASCLLVGTYIASGIGQVWERWSSYGLRPLVIALIELLIIGSSLIAYSIGDASVLILLCCLLAFPIARIAVLLGSSRAETVYRRNATEAQPIARYISFSLAQQLMGAISASLPSIFSQVTGQYSDLPRNLVIFRFAHSVAASASLVVNAVGSRLFYGTADKHIYELESRIVDNSRRISSFVVLAALGSCLSIQIGSNHIYPAISLFVLILVIANLESSFLINCGLPEYTFYCQLFVLIISIGLLLLVTKNVVLFQGLAFVIAIGFSSINRKLFVVHRRAINRRIHEKGD